MIQPSKKQLLGLSTPVNYLVLANIILIIASRLVYSAITNRDSEYIVVPILQMLVFVIPAMIFLWLGGSREMSPSRFRLTILRPAHIPLVAAATLMLITGGLLLSIIFGGIDSLKSNFSLYDTFISKNGGRGNTIYLIMTYALIPAVCEEMTYRSILCAKYEDRGITCAIAVSTLLFGILHLNAPLLPIYLFSGALLALTMYATRSVFASITVHFLYNLFCIFSQPLVTKFYQTTPSTGLFVILLIIIFMLSAIVFCFVSGKLYLKYAKANKITSYPTALTPKEHTSAIIETILNLPLILCVLIYVITAIIIK